MARCTCRGRSGVAVSPALSIHLETVAEIGSTNAELARRLRAGEDVHEGAWLIADRQSAGRGRQGRTWFDGAGNFMGSNVVQLRADDPPPASLALVAGVALHAAAAPLVPPPQRASLKWPNDVLIGGAKLAGILLERKGDAVIVGIGVNLAAAPALPDRETIALTAFGPAPDRDTFARVLAAEFTAALADWRSTGLDPLLVLWQDAAHSIGTPLVVGEPGEVPLGGTYDGLSADGALRLRLADGQVRVIHAGEVRLAAPGTP